MPRLGSHSIDVSTLTAASMNADIYLKALCLMASCVHVEMRYSPARQLCYLQTVSSQNQEKLRHSSAHVLLVPVLCFRMTRLHQHPQT
eukprot:6188570-Pleurochrysis_carterae.AAC.2